MQSRNIIYAKLKTILDAKYRDSRNRLIIPKTSIFFKHLLEHFNFCNNISEIYYCLENNISEHKKCLYCNENTNNVKSNTCASRICRNKFVASKIDYKKRNEKTKISLLSKYNVTNVSQIPIVKEKIKDTMFKKFGSEYYFGSIEHKNMLSLNNPTIKFNNIQNYQNKSKEFIENNFIIDNKLNVEKCKEYFNISITTINRWKKLKNVNFDNFFNYKQNIEQKINENFNSRFIINNRQLINPLEIDLLSTEFKLGIEYNGLLWHSFGKNYPYNLSIDKNKHLIKTELCEEKEYQLFHIFEDEFLDKNKKEIWFSIIRNKLKLNNKLYARKCSIKEVSSKESNSFLEKNHLQGKCNAKIRLGLYFNEELVSLMTFSKSRYNKNVEYELIRFCSKINTTIIGAGSKLLKYFERNYKPRSIISYANRRFSRGKVYEELGFEFIKNTEPNYFYFRPGENKLLSRVQFQKHKLEEKLEVFNSELTELENMINNGYRVIYDCGNKVYIKVIDENS